MECGDIEAILEGGEDVDIYMKFILLGTSRTDLTE